MELQANLLHSLLNSLYLPSIYLSIQLSFWYCTLVEWSDQTPAWKCVTQITTGSWLKKNPPTAGCGLHRALSRLYFEDFRHGPTNIVGIPIMYEYVQYKFNRPCLYSNATATASIRVFGFFNSFLQPLKGHFFQKQYEWNWTQDQHE